MIITETSSNKGRRHYTRAGKIRVGGMVPSKKTASNPQALSIYNQGVASGLKFDDIAKRITDATGISNPLYPDSRTPYFRLVPDDFPMPDVAERIMEKYGEDRGDGVKRLYRFPVSFVSKDDIQVGFIQYKGEPLHQSYIQDGVRRCRSKIYGAAKDGASRGSKTIPVFRDEGECNPDECRNCLSGKCQWRADLWFKIPGSGIRSMFQLSTGSEFATEDLEMELVRIQNENSKGGQQWLTKKQMKTRHGSKPYVVCLLELEGEEDDSLDTGVVLANDAVESNETVEMPKTTSDANPDEESVWLSKAEKLLEEFSISDNRQVLEFITWKYGQDWRKSPESCRDLYECLLKFQKHGPRAGMLFLIKILIERHGLASSEIHRILQENIAKDYILNEQKLELALDFLRSYVS